jgi:hypothetical protein
MFTKKRCDGTYIKDLPHFTRILPYLMPSRAESCIYFEQDFDVTKTLEYVASANAARKPGGVRLSFFQVFLCAAVRTIALRPKLNRFVAGYRYYRRNRIIFNFVAKREMTDEGGEINVNLPFSPKETLTGLAEKLTRHVLAAKRGESDEVDSLNAFLAKLPRFAMRLVAKALFWADYHNGLPASFVKGMPFFSSVFFTNVGSVGIEAPFHHNFEFGTCGLFVAIGKIRQERAIGADGQPCERELVKITFTFDDRITDGIYCGRAIDLLRSFVEDPTPLEKEPELTPELVAELALAE